MAQTGVRGERNDDQISAQLRPISAKSFPAIKPYERHRIVA
jgi:hypothetical protein